MYATVLEKKKVYVMHYTFWVFYVCKKQNINNQMGLELRKKAKYNVSFTICFTTSPLTKYEIIHFISWRGRTEQ